MRFREAVPPWEVTINLRLGFGSTPERVIRLPIARAPSQNGCGTGRSHTSKDIGGRSCYGIRVDALLRAPVAPFDGKTADVVGMGRLDVEPAIADHPYLCGAEDR